MNQREISELRRRWRPEKSAVSRVYGCFVNSARKIVSDLDESLGAMPQEEAEQYLDHYLLVTKELEIPKLCDNAVVNTVADYYRMLSAEQDICFSARIAIPADLAVQDIDLSVLIGNLLENAFDAALLVEGEARFIPLQHGLLREDAGSHRGQRL